MHFEIFCSKPHNPTSPNTHTHAHTSSHCSVLTLTIVLLFIGIHLLKLFLRYSNIRNKTEVLGQLINLIDLRFENGNLDKEDDSITPQRGNSQKIFSIILRRIWKYRMYVSIDVKCFTWIQIARSFRFVARFLYVLGLSTKLLASSPYYEIALMTSYTFCNKKYSVLLKIRSSWFHSTLHSWDW